ncbi:substrate-binding periplasmic protein [Paucibacter soli]|uniref:substrate-binding periplasmic protein n=1 Tax=Paucibacter soli TaxID=3133433 RepID=UPI0030B7F148
MNPRITASSSSTPGKTWHRRRWLGMLALLACSSYSKADSTEPEAMPAEAKVLHLVTTEFAPYMGEKLPEQGVAVALARAALASQGWRLKVAFRPWARALTELEAAQHDGVIGAWYQPERERFMDFAKPMGIDNLVGYFGLAKRYGVGTKQLPLDLAGLHIGTVQGYANPQAFEQAVQLGAKADPARDDLTNLRKLLAGRVDLVLIDKGVARYLISTELKGAATQFVWLEPALERMPLHIAMAKSRPQHQALRELMDRGQEAIARSGEYERIRQRWKDWL